jgi:hypothetical protein
LDLLTPHIFTPRNYRQCSAIADLHTIQFTVMHTLGFSVFTSRILATDFITVSLSLRITHEVFFSQTNSFLAIILQLPVPKTRLNSIPLLSSSYPGRLASRSSTFHLEIWNSILQRLCTDHVENSISIVGKACLQRICIATEVT